MPSKLYSLKPADRTATVAAAIGSTTPYGPTERQPLVDAVVELTRGGATRTIRGRAIGVAWRGTGAQSDALVLNTAGGLELVGLATLAAISPAPLGAHLAEPQR